MAREPTRKIRKDLRLKSAVFRVRFMFDIRKDELKLHPKIDQRLVVLPDQWLREIAKVITD